jgi:predicted dehydrogenase
MNAKGTVVVLEGCLGNWSKKSYMENLLMRAKTGEITLYAVDVMDIEKNEDLEQLYGNSAEFINKVYEKDKYDSIGQVDYVFVVAPPAVHCEIAAHWLVKGRLKKGGKILIEKPLDSSRENVENLGDEPKNLSDKILVIDHYIPKISPLVEKLSKININVEKIRALKCDILESDPIQDSRVGTLNDGLIMDMFPHVLAVLAKIMKIVDKRLDERFKLDADRFEIFDINIGKYQSSKIKGETFARIVGRINGIPIESGIGKAVGYADRKVLKIFLENGSVIVDFVSKDFLINVRDEKGRTHHTSGKLFGKPVDMLIDTILNGKNFDPTKFLSFDEGFEIVKIVSKIREKRGKSVRYRKFSPKHKIMGRIGHDKKSEENMMALLKQYDFLGSEIAQSIYLEHAAILGLYTFLGLITAAFVGMEKGGDLSFLIQSLRGFSLMTMINKPNLDRIIPVFLVLLFIQATVNAFGSLFLKEQCRIRRACSFQKVIEFLIDERIGKLGMYWQSYLTSPLLNEEKKWTDYFKFKIPINKQYYKNRLLSIGLPIYLPNLFITSLVCLFSFAYYEKGFLIFLILVGAFFATTYYSRSVWSMASLFWFTLFLGSIFWLTFGREFLLLLALLLISELMTFLWGLMIIRKTFSPLSAEEVPSRDEILAWLEEEEEILNIQEAVQNK